MDHLDQLEAQSIFIFREAFHANFKLVMLWSFGKDSNVMIHLVRKAFFGRVPFSLIHCDTELEMDEVYKFRDKYAKEWGVHLISHICPPLEATDASLPNAARVAARKTLALKEVTEKYGFTGIIAGIRRDEEATRAKERVFSPRGETGQWDVQGQPPEFWDQFKTSFAPGTSVRIHPLLHWTELDIWQYVRREDIPIVPLYFAKPYHQLDGHDFAGRMMRFRSLGEKGITWPVESTAATLDEIIAELRVTKVSERSGRPMGADEDESSFERLRADGYM
ncbi:MAG: sulfate adenylyltransferase subunit 2 [Pseudomonadota bacterium]|nr:sulfate adenylyltransferase subunit 2 [Pseudomonadota bacterium]MDE3037749.1 sulfate adenylyltransferase subunit 2 [Pseudomonadota bacterium]